MQQEKKVLCSFSLQGKKWKSLFIFFYSVSLLQTLLQRITGWVGKALSPQSRRQDTVTTVIWERNRLLQLTAVEEWLAQKLSRTLNTSFWPLIPSENSSLAPYCRAQANTQLQACLLNSNSFTQSNLIFMEGSV